MIFVWKLIWNGNWGMLESGAKYSIICMQMKYKNVLFSLGTIWFLPKMNLTHYKTRVKHE